MTLAVRLFLLGVVLGCWASAGVARAGALIEFPNVSEQAKPPHLLGYPARPGGTGSFPAVVVLHGCHGFFSEYPEVADRLESWGYVAPAVDSFGLHGITNCNHGFTGQETDSYAALDYLSQQPFVDPDRVAVLGYSMGGATALRDVERGLIAPMFKRSFRAAIAYYPHCNGDVGMSMAVPTMILIGASDDWVPAEACRRLAAQPRGSGAPIDLTVYPGAYHAFNFSEFQPGGRHFGHWLEYNEPAARDTEAKLRAFLAANLGSAGADNPAGQ